MLLQKASQAGRRDDSLVDLFDVTVAATSISRRRPLADPPARPVFSP